MGRLISEHLPARKPGEPRPGEVKKVIEEEPKIEEAKKVIEEEFIEKIAEELAPNKVLEQPEDNMRIRLNSKKKKRR